MTDVTIEGLPEFERTAAAAARELGDLGDAHRTAGDVLLQQPQPRTPSVATEVRFDATAGLTTVTAGVIYAGGEGDALINDTTTAEIVEAFSDEIARIVSTIHGT